MENKLREALEKELPQNLKLEGNLRKLKDKNETYNFVLNVFTLVINELPEDPEDSIADMTSAQKEKFQKLTPAMKQDLL